MKYAAIFLVILLLGAIGGVSYLYMTSEVIIQGITVTAIEASAQQDTFDRIVSQAQGGRLIGTLFSSEPMADSSNYQFLVYTVHLRNNTALTADTIEVQVTPMAGDVLQLGDYSQKYLPAHTSGELTATILADVSMHPVREVTVTYYIWGMPFRVKGTVGVR